MPAIVDHHAHIFSPSASRLLGGQIGKVLPPFTGRELARVLTTDKVEKVAVLSVAYMHSEPPDVAAENDWLAEQTANDRRMAPFMSVNPLAVGAVAEVERCVARRCFAGLKLHMANSQVDLRDEEHRRSLAAVVAAARAHALPIVLHLRAARGHGVDDARRLAEVVLPAAGDLPVQIAHVAGWGGYDSETSAAFRALVSEARSANWWFDISAAVRGTDRDSFDRLVEDLSQAPMDRILFGTDWPDWTPRAYIDDLSGAGIDADRILRNRAPWMD